MIKILPIVSFITRLMIVISITDKWYKHTTYKGEEFAHTSLHLG